MTDSEEQNDELLALSEILERKDFLYSLSEEGLNTGLMSVTVNLVEESGLQVGGSIYPDVMSISITFSICR